MSNNNQVITIEIDGIKYQHISTLDEKPGTVQKRLARNKKDNTTSVDPKTKKQAVKLPEGWWVEV